MPPSLRLLTPAFFDRDPRRVARALLGKVLLRRTASGILAGRIVETEAYLGKGDAAAHSAAGRTLRNSVIFGPPGRAYVYFVYGNHYCLNVSCLPDGDPGCVLLRALEPLAGIEQMAKARGIVWGREMMWEREMVLEREMMWGRAPSQVRPERSRRVQAERRSAVASRRPDSRGTIATASGLRRISSGPGRLAEALGVTRDRDNGKNFTSAQSDLQIVDDGHGTRKIETTVRVGIAKAAEKRLRYFIAANAWVSGARR